MGDTKFMWGQDLGRNKWQLFFLCDVQVTMYRDKWLGYTGWGSKTRNRIVIHLIHKPIMKTSATPYNLNSSFSSLLSPASFVRPHTRLFVPTPSPPFVFVMPKKVGPWQLDDVKARLRAEQVGRERAASARYRAQERRDSGEDNKGKTSCAQCIFLLALSCFLFSLSVLAFASAFLSIYREIEWTTSWWSHFALLEGQKAEQNHP